jgi:hypothetical protein
VESLRLLYNLIDVVLSSRIPRQTAIMAHIADFMVDADLPNSVGLNNYIAREVSPAPSHEIVSLTRYILPLSSLTDIQPSEVPSAEEKEKHVWRMHQPSESRRLHLFPSREKLSIGSAGRKSPDTASQSSKAGGEKGQGENERSTIGSTKRSKSKDPKPKDGQSLVRRRKVSVPELGPMTTVQEVAMDSRE